MVARRATVFGLFGVLAFSDASAQERKYVVTATLQACATAIDGCSSSELQHDAAGEVT